MKPRRILVALLAALLLVWGGYRIYRAHAKLVTLNVRNMDVRQVVSKIEWQTWERILVNKDVSGKVTLDVRNVPLEEVLNIIGLQTDARWTRLYPIYSSGKAAVTFNKVVRGDLPAATSGWKNWQNVSPWQLNGMSGFGNIARAANNLVSAQILNKDLAFAVLALSRFSQARVIPEDGAAGTINLKLQQAPFKKAVAQIAKQAHRKWDEMYTLQPLKTVKVASKVADAGGGDTNQVLDVVVTKPESTPQTREMVQEAFLATMTPEERQKVQEQMATMEQLKSLPAAEQQQRMQEMKAQASQASQADAEQRIQNRLKNGTTDQRIAHDRQMLQKRPQNP